MILIQNHELHQYQDHTRVDGSTAVICINRIVVPLCGFWLCIKFKVFIPFYSQSLVYFNYQEGVCLIDFVCVLISRNHPAPLEQDRLSLQHGCKMQDS